MANSASFSAVFGSQSSAGVAAQSFPWSPAHPASPNMLAILPPGPAPSPPSGQAPNGPMVTPNVSQGGSGGSGSHEIGCKKSEVHRCDSSGKRQNKASDNTHIQILSGDVVGLKALAAVYGKGLCPGMLCSPLFRNHSHKHCDCPGQTGHTTKYNRCHKMPRSGYGPRHAKTWEEVKNWKASKKKKKPVKNSKKKK